MTLTRFALLALAFLTAAAFADEPPLRRIAFGSCLGQDGVQPIWQQVLAAKPDAFVFLGDNVYADTADPVELRAAYAKLGAQPGYQTLQEERRGSSRPGTITTTGRTTRAASSR